MTSTRSVTSARARSATTPGFRPRRRSVSSSGAKTARSERVATQRWAKLSASTAMLLLFITAFLSLLGLTMVLSASSVSSITRTGSPWGEFRSQLMWLGLGAVALLTTSFLDHRWLRRLTLPALLATLGLLLAVLTPLGVNVNGAQRWLRLGAIQFQPSELAKLTLVLYAAHVLARTDRKEENQRVVPILVVLVVYGALILAQPNLGTAIIVFAIGLSILYAAGVRLWVLAIIGSVSVIGASMLAYYADYRRARLLSFMDPWADPLDGGWQTIQSLVSVANGGVTGVGIGASRGKYGYLPEAHNDFVFAVTAEEFGLVGASVVVLAFVTFGLAALLIARRADRFGSLLVVGIATWVLIQAFINVGAVLGVMPITGVPLPFMSAGGTSLVTTLAAVGVVINVARTSK